MRTSRGRSRDRDHGSSSSSFDRRRQEDFTRDPRSRPEESRVMGRGKDAIVPAWKSSGSVQGGNLDDARPRRDVDGDRDRPPRQPAPSSYNNTNDSRNSMTAPIRNTGLSSSTSSTTISKNGGTGGGGSTSASNNAPPPNRTLPPTSQPSSTHTWNTGSTTRTAPPPPTSNGANKPSTTTTATISTRTPHNPSSSSTFQTTINTVAALPIPDFTGGKKPPPIPANWNPYSTKSFEEQMREAINPQSSSRTSATAPAATAPVRAPAPVAPQPQTSTSQYQSQPIPSSGQYQQPYQAYAAAPQAQQAPQAPQAQQPPPQPIASSATQDPMMDPRTAWVARSIESSKDPITGMVSEAYKQRLQLHLATLRVQSVDWNSHPLFVEHPQHYQQQR